MDSMTCNEKGAVREKKGAWDPGRNNKIHTHIKKRKEKKSKVQNQFWYNTAP